MAAGVMVLCPGGQVDTKSLVPTYRSRDSFKFNRHAPETRRRWDKESKERSKQVWVKTKPRDIRDAGLC